MKHLVRQQDVVTLPDALFQPKGTAWCLDPFMVRFRDRISQFLADIEANTETAQAARFQIPTPDPSGHLWTATVPRDLATGVHLLEIRSKDEFGNQSRANKIFEVCEQDFDSIGKGRVLIRDCVLLTSN
jgi:hypothetical protein